MENAKYILSVCLKIRVKSFSEKGKGFRGMRSMESEYLMSYSNRGVCVKSVHGYHMSNGWNCEGSKGRSESKLNNGNT